MIRTREEHIRSAREAVVKEAKRQRAIIKRKEWVSEREWLQALAALDRAVDRLVKLEGRKP
jgi:hypothetical protein